jgi:hypothetical protein
MHVQSASPHTPQQQHNGGQFGILTTEPMQNNSIARLQQEEDLFGTPEGSDQKSNGHLSTKIVVTPPNLAEWRQRLFDVDDMITLSEEECVSSDINCLVVADSVYLGTKHTFLMLIMSIHTVLPRPINASPSSPTIGTAVLRADRQEHPSQTIRTRRRESELLESVIFVMSRSKSRNTCRVLCWTKTSFLMEANQIRAITSSLRVNLEGKQYTNTSLAWH